MRINYTLLCILDMNTRRAITHTTHTKRKPFYIILVNTNCTVESAYGPITGKETDRACHQEIENNKECEITEVQCDTSE